MFEKLRDYILIKLDVHRKRHQEFHRKHQEFHRRHLELHRHQQELCWHHQEFQRKHREFNQYYKALRFLRPVSVVFNLIILYLLFSWVGTRLIGIVFAVFIIIKEFLQFSFFRRVERRVFKPLHKFKNGLEEIAKGNYNVKIERDINNDLGFIGLLADSFNEMAQKLQMSEQIKSEYEENRKMLVANISHDLKTPITTVQGYIEAILDGVVVAPEKVSMYLKTIYQNTVYMDKLIDDLFLFSKLDLQKLDFQMENIHVKAFMNDLMEEFKFELEEKQYAFYYNDQLKVDCLIKIDRKRLYQAFRNIIGNAVKHGTNNNLMIRIVLDRQDDFITINIEDNGPGIPEDKLPNIFNRFYRIDNERTKDLMSTGLGLAIAKELIQAHGGLITVSSVEQEGTCFNIQLPVMNELGK